MNSFVPRMQRRFPGPRGRAILRPRYDELSMTSSIEWKRQRPPPASPPAVSKDPTAFGPAHGMPSLFASRARSLVNFPEYVVGKPDQLDFQLKIDAELFMDRPARQLDQLQHILGSRSAKVDDKVRMAFRNLSFPPARSLQARIFDQLGGEVVGRILEHAARIGKIHRLRAVPFHEELPPLPHDLGFVPYREPEGGAQDDVIAESRSAIRESAFRFRDADHLVASQHTHLGEIIRNLPAVG